MANLRNFLLAVGVYWLSTWIAIPLSIAFPNAHVYGESPLKAVLFGMELEMGRAVAAACAGVIVALLAAGNKPEWWALVVAVLYLIRPARFTGQLAPWYRIVRSTTLIFPALLCLAAAFIVGHFYGKRIRHVDS